MSARTRWVAGGTAAVTALALFGGGYARLGASDATDAQVIESGTTELACDGGTFDAPITNLAAGDASSRSLALRNTGSTDFDPGSVTLTPVARGGTALTTSPNGVSLTVRSGDRVVLPATLLSAWTEPLALDLTAAEVAAGASANLSFLWSLPSGAPNSLQGLSDSVSFRCDADQAAGETGKSQLGLGYEGEEFLNLGESLEGVAKATGVVGTLRYSLRTGAPAWMTIDPTSGAIGGTPTESGDHSVTIEVVDASWRSASRDVTITVIITIGTPGAPASVATKGMTYGRQGTGTEVVGGKVYAVGGYTSPTPGDARTVERLDPATGKWTLVAPMSVTRMNPATATVGGRVYAFGGAGYSGGEDHLSSAEVYDPASNTWSAVPAMPAARSFATAVASGDSIYVIGGWGRLANGDYGPTSTVFEFDTKTRVWTTLANTIHPRSGASAAVIDGSVYLVGGARSAGARDSRGYLLGEWIVEVLDLSDPSGWAYYGNPENALPERVDSSGVEVVDGRLWILGGIIRGGGYSGSVHVFDPYSASWTTGPTVTYRNASGVERAGRAYVQAGKELSSALLGDTLYTVGGFVSGNTVNDVTAFDVR